MAYEPEPLVLANAEATVQELASYVSRELQRVSAGFVTEQQFLHLEELHVEPSKPRNGMVVMADGTDWNPGSGAGYYGYRAAAWRFLG